jgi:hypothetical protein
MALIDSKQLNPKFTGSFTLSGSSQTLVGAKVEFTNANAKISGSATSTGSFGQVETQGFGTTAKTLISGSTNATTVSGSWRGWASASIDHVFGGRVRVIGDVLAENYIVSSSVTYLTQSFASGSHIFGDSLDDTHEFTGSLFVTGSSQVSGTLKVTKPATGSTAIYTNNLTNGYPTSNQWQTGLGGSYFNNFDNTTHVSEILRFVAGLLSASAPDASPNTGTWSSISTQENSLGSTDTVDGYLPQSYDSSNATMLYLVSKDQVAEGGTIFSGRSTYTNTSFTVDYDSVAGGSTTVSSSVDSQLFGLGGLTSGGATEFNVSQSYQIQFSDTGSNVATFTTGSKRLYTISSFGTSDGLTLTKIATSNPAVIPAAYQDGKFSGVGSLSRKYHSTETNMSSSVSASGAFTMSAILGVATGSGGGYVFKAAATSSRFYAPISYISTQIGTNSLDIRHVTQSYLTATSRSLSGVPYLIGATYHISASIRGLFNPMYAASTTIVDDSVGSVGVGSVAGSGMDDVSTSGGTISTANAVFASDSGSVRSTGVIPTRNDIVKFNATYTLSGTTAENINETGLGDTTFTVTVRGRNRESSRSNLNTQTFQYHTASSFTQPASSGSMAVYQRAQGYDGGTLTGTSEAFTGESFRIKLNNNVLGFNGDAFATSSFNVVRGAAAVIGEHDLQVKPGFLVEPGDSYGYWYPTSYGSGSYKYYIRRFQDGSTRTSMTIDVGATLVNWKATTADSVAAALLFKSSASGSGASNELSVARIYDPSELTSNAISSSVAHQTDFFLNPFNDALHLYGNTGGSKSTTQYTLPIRNADGMYLDSNDNELYVILRYAGNPTPVTGITLTFS